VIIHLGLLILLWSNFISFTIKLLRAFRCPLCRSLVLYCGEINISMWLCIMIFKLDICAGVIFSFIITQFIFRFSYNFAHWILEVTNTCLESRLFFSGIWYFLLGTTAFLIIESSHYHILLLVFLIKLFLIRSHSMAVDVFYSSLIISATEYILKSLPNFFWDISPLA